MINEDGVILLCMYPCWSNLETNDSQLYIQMKLIYIVPQCHAGPQSSRPIKEAAFPWLHWLPVQTRLHMVPRIINASPPPCRQYYFFLIQKIYLYLCSTGVSKINLCIKRMWGLLSEESGVKCLNTVLYCVVLYDVSVLCTLDDYFKIR